MINSHKTLLGLLLAIGTAAAGACGPVPREMDGETEQADDAHSGINLIKAVHSGKCADVAGVSTANGAIVHQWTCHGRANQQWTLKSVSSGVYNIISVNSGKCMDVTGQSTLNRAQVQQWTCGGGDNQKW